jgi:hypothetical protein
MTRKIVLKINAGEKYCDDCEYLTYFSTGLIGEWHMRCDIFDVPGPWRKHNMRRTKECLRAEQYAKT